MSRALLLLGATGVILASSLLSLAGVAWNRQGEPESLLSLTERELPIAWNSFGPQENSNLALRLDWTQENRRAGDWRGPDWLGREALIALGFADLPEDGLSDYPRWTYATRPALIVLELDGPAYQRELTRATTELARKREQGAAADLLKTEEAALQRLRERDTRLYAVDAGPDRLALRQRYPDRQRYALVPARITANLTQHEQRWYVRGYVSELRVGDLHLPLALRERLRLERSKAAEQRAPYRAELALGQRLEPWITDLQLEPAHD